MSVPLSHPATRRKMTTYKKAKRMLAKGMSPKDIAAKLGTSVNYIYVIRSQERKKEEQLQAIVRIEGRVEPVNLSYVTIPDTSSLDNDRINDRIVRTNVPEADPPPAPQATVPPTLWQRVKQWVGAWR